MKHFAFIGLFLTTFTIAGFAQQTSNSLKIEYIRTDQEIANKVSTAKQFILVILKTGPTRNQDKEAAEIIQRDHLRYVFYLRENHGLRMQGPIVDAKGNYQGIEIFDSKDKDFVKHLLENDPAVKAGRMTVEVYDWFGLPGDFLK